MTYNKASQLQRGPATQSGFTLVEMAIVLLIAGLLVAGISQMMSASQKNRSDQAVANEVRTVTNALERFLVDQQAALSTATNIPDGTINRAAGGTGLNSINISINGNNPGQYFQNNYLPANYANNLAAYGINVQRQNINGRPSFRALILRVPDGPLDDGRLSRIASLIGTQGGMISNNAGATGAVTGVLGSWSLNASDYSYQGAGCNSICALPGTIAALTNTVDAQISVNTLARINPAGSGVQSEGNTMRTDLYMGDGATGTNGQATTAANNIVNVSSIGFVVADVSTFTNGAANGGFDCTTGTVELYSSPVAIPANDLGTVAANTIHNRIFLGFNSANPTTPRVQLYECSQ